MENLEPYKSLRTVIYEVQTASKPATQPPSAPKEKKINQTWKTAGGKWGAKNKDGAIDYFEDEDSAKAWISGNFKPAGRVDKPGDTSVPVELDRDGYEAQKSAEETPVKAKPKGTTEPIPVSKLVAPPPKAKAQTAADNTQSATQPQNSETSTAQSDTEEHPDIGANNPETEFDSHIKPDPKATEKAKAKPDIRKANVVAKAIKSGNLNGPQSDAESVFGDAAAEQRFIEEMNHAALSAMRGQQAYDFELCSEVFAHLGLCFEPKTKQKVSKGIPRDQMPQFSSQVDPNRTDTPAFQALMRGKSYTSPDQVTPEDLKSEVNMEREYRKALEDSGYDVVEEDVSVTTLKPIQGQLKGEKIAGMYGTLAAAQADPQNYGKFAARLLEPIYVSDGYVVDGHHRWAAQVAIDIANGAGANATMKTRTISKGGKPVPVEEIIKFSNKFQKDIGLLSQTRGGETVQEKKPTKEEYLMNKFKTNRLNRVVLKLHESNSKSKSAEAENKIYLMKTMKISTTPGESAFQTLYRHGFNHYIVSYSTIAGETMIFKADKTGKVTNWLDLWVERKKTDHNKAIIDFLSHSKKGKSSSFPKSFTVIEGVIGDTVQRVKSQTDSSEPGAYAFHTLYRHGSDYYLVMYFSLTKETMIFPANKRGNVADWADLWMKRGKVDHNKAIKDYLGSVKSNSGKSFKIIKESVCAEDSVCVHEKNEPSDSVRFSRAMQPLKNRKTDRYGNIIKSASVRSATRKSTDDSIAQNQTTAQDLITTIEMKPVGTTFEIYGKKGGKETKVKVKKIMKTGEKILVVGNTEVDLHASGNGLQVLNKSTRRALLDGGNDMIWESEDFIDVGRLYISEMRKLLPWSKRPPRLSDTELETISIKRRKRFLAAKSAAANKRVAQGRAAWKKIKTP